MLAEIKVEVRPNFLFKMWLMRAKYVALIRGVYPSDDEIKKAVNCGVDVFIGGKKC